METSIKPIILDFYGLPGAGKSTVSHLLAESLTKKGYTVSEPTYNTAHKMNPVFRKIVKLSGAVIYSIMRPELFRQNLRLARKCGYSNPKDISSQITNIMIKYFTLRKKTSLDYIIFDEGLCQSAVSLCVMRCPEKTNIIAKYLYRYLSGKFTIIPIYLKIEMQQALIQMEKRASNDSRVEKIKSDKEKECLMKKYLNACNNIDYPDKLIINSKSKKPMEIETRIEHILAGYGML